MPSVTPYAPPAWAAALHPPPKGRVGLAHLPVPIERWTPPSVPRDAECWICRDDLTGAALSGNKVRKLAFLLAEAIDQGCDTVLTCGGLQSNHARATALAARRVGMEPILFLRTAAVDTDPGLAGNLLLDRLAGATLRLITPDQYREREALLAAEAERLRAQGRKPYVIPEGGSSPLGCWGYLDAVEEWSHHPAFRAASITDVVVALGSGGTVAGLALGLHLAGHPARVHAVNVCDDAAYFYRRIDALYAHLGAPVSAREVVDVVEGYVGRGYALSREEELRLLAHVATETGIVLDPVYTGKAFFGWVHERQKNPDRFGRGATLFVHTGGLFGCFDKAEELRPLL